MARFHFGAVVDSVSVDETAALSFRRRRLTRELDLLHTHDWVWVLAVTVVAAALRLYHLTALSLWVDEGLTVAYSHLDWATALGLHGAYAPHPPLYIALVKVVSLVAPDVVAGRLVSAVAGTLTVPVIYALARRLASPAAGLAAGLVLALSPMHVWYSQEARPYALNVLLVCLSYLALVTFLQTRARTWAVLYGCVSALSLYVEYSAIYALVPQAIILALAIRRSPRQHVPLIIAGAAAALAFVPWLPQLLHYAHMTSEQAQFALTPDKIAAVGIAITGIAGYNGYYLGSLESPWDTWPALHPLAILCLAGIATAGVAALWRRDRTSAAVPLCLWLGTFGAAVGMGLVYPGFTYRTVLYAVPGWALVCGGALAGAAATLQVRVAGRAAALFFVATGVMTLGAIYGGAFKQQYRLLAAATAQAGSLDLPVLTYPVVTSTLISVYDPHAIPHHLWVDRFGHLPSGLRTGRWRPPSLWYAYSRGQFFDESLRELHRLGYRRLFQTFYTGPLFLDLWVLPRSHLGEEEPLSTAFASSPTGIDGWILPPGAVVRRRDSEDELTLANRGTQEQRALTAERAEAGDLYALHVQARSRLVAGGIRTFLICTSASGDFLDVAPNGAGASVPNDGKWHSIEIGVQCPSATRGLLVDLRNSGRGVVAFRRVRLERRRPGLRAA